MGYKYIVIRVDLDGGLRQDLPVIFPDNMIHSEVATSLVRTKPLRDRNAVVVSAGSCDALLRVHKDSKSDTLDIASREIDNELFSSHDYGARGIVGLYEGEEKPS